MPTYRVTGPDGQVVSFAGPAGMSKADVVTRAKQEAKFSSGEIPTTFAGGASKQLLEKEPAARNALLAAPALFTPAGPAMAITAAAPFVGTGLKALSQLLHTGSADAPASSELAGDAAEAGLSLAAGPAIKKGAQLVGVAKDAVAGAVPSWMRSVASMSGKGMAMDAATSKPVMGAVEQFGDAISPQNLNRTFRSVIRGLTPGDQVIDEAGPAVVDRFMPNRSRVSREVPGSSYPEAASPAPELPQSFQALTDQAVDRGMPNVSGYQPPSDADTMSRLLAAPEAPGPAIERYTPNTSAYDDAATASSTARVPYGVPDVATPSPNAGGRLVPGTAPTNILDEALSGLAGEPPTSVMRPTTGERPGISNFREEGPISEPSSSSYTGPERRAVVRKDADRVSSLPTIPRSQLDVAPTTRPINEVLSAFQANQPTSASLSDAPSLSALVKQRDAFADIPESVEFNNADDALTRMDPSFETGEGQLLAERSRRNSAPYGPITPESFARGHAMLHGGSSIPSSLSGLDDGYTPDFSTSKGLAEFNTRNANAAGSAFDVTPADPTVPMAPRMPVARLKRIMEAFANTPEANKTPFDDEVLDLILQNPDGVGDYRNPYGASGKR
jgi:hypothetical protein